MKEICVQNLKKKTEKNYVSVNLLIESINITRAVKRLSSLSPNRKINVLSDNYIPTITKAHKLHAYAFQKAPQHPSISIKWTLELAKISRKGNFLRKNHKKVSYTIIWY